MVDSASPRMRYAESAWERVVPSPVVDDAFLDEHLAPWPELRRRTWTLLSGGLRHVNLRAGDVVARIAPSGGVRRQAALLRRMRGRVRVPAVIDVRERVLLLEHVPHEEMPATVEAARCAGRALAAIHEDVGASAGTLGDDGRIAEAFDDALEALLRWSDACRSAGAGARLGSLAPRVSDAWRRSREALARACDPPTLLHGDFKPANVKWLPLERDVLVLDWEFAWYGPAPMDVGQFLRWETSREIADAFVAEACVGRAESRDELRRLGALFDLFNLVGLLDHAEPAPVRDRDLVRRVETTLDALGVA